MTRRLALAISLSLVCAGGLGTAAHAAFPGANGRIAFTREPGPGQPDTPAQIFAVNADQSAFGPITAAIEAERPAWSPTGQLIAYSAPDPVETNRTRIWVARADGTGAHEVAPAPNVSDLSPSWSPDGARLVFERQHWSDTTISADELDIGNADGSGAATPIPGTDYEQSPAWSPDGAHIAFAHYRATASYTIAMIGTDGTGFVTLDDPGTLSDGFPAWSPDGRTVFFSRGQESVGCFSQSQIYAVPAAPPGSAAPVSRDPGFSDYQPAPSPDGTRVAFVRCDDPTDNVHHVYTMNPDGTGVLPATSGATVDDYYPNWQPTAPQFRSAPTLTGRSVNNQTLTATEGASSAGTTTLIWERCNRQQTTCLLPPAAAASRAHAAAATATYRLTSADIGFVIRVQQIQTNAAGSSSSVSSPTGSVVPSRAHCSNRFAGTARADRIRGSSGSDRISGGRGRDRLSGLNGSDCIAGGAGNDILSGGRGNDTVSGGAGNDRITAGPGKNRVSGGSGNDTINVRNHRRDVVSCGKGKQDRVVADRSDRLRGCERIRRRR
jgi:hypothetical protein